MSTKNLTILCLTALLFASVFWPGIYKYDHVSYPGGLSLPVRVNRLTGATAQFSQGQWQTVVAEVEPSALPPEELKKLTGTGDLNGSSFSFTLYNGSRWEVEEVEIELQVLPVDSMQGRQGDASNPFSDLFTSKDATPVPNTTADSLAPSGSHSRRFRQTVSPAIDPLTVAKEISIEVGDFGNDYRRYTWRIIAAVGHLYTP
jgi:hypothetical protein